MRSGQSSFGQIALSHTAPRHRPVRADIDQPIFVFDKAPHKLEILARRFDPPCRHAAPPAVHCLRKAMPLLRSAQHFWLADTPSIEAFNLACDAAKPPMPTPPPAPTTQMHRALAPTAQP